MKRIVLFGYRGTGKTAIGTVLAQKLGVPFLDTDALVEQQAGRTIPEIFRDSGEAGFRAREREAVSGLPDRDAIIATGGGVVMDPANMEHLRKESVCVLLSADPNVIGHRLAHAPRPALTSLSPTDEITAMLKHRRPAYAAAADFCIDTGRTTAGEAAEKILTLLGAGSIPDTARHTAARWFAATPLPAPEKEELERKLLGPGYDPQTRFLGVAGWPCGHSKSPVLFNRLFEHYRLNCHYTRFEAPEIGPVMEMARLISAKGLSVTIPFKQDVMSYLDEIDEAAQKIGAVNTVVFACGRAYGWNTDWIGIRKPLAHLSGSRAVLLGAGGVAAAAAYALRDLDMEIIILNRTPEKARALAERTGCRFGAWDDFDRTNPDLVVNATSIGMQPDTGSPLRDDQLKKEMTVCDLVYTPPVTSLIAAARKAGCTTILGTETFVYQAQEQFRLFFGIDVPDTTIREILA